MALALGTRKTKLGLSIALYIGETWRRIGERTQNWNDEQVDKETTGQNNKIILRYGRSDRLFILSGSLEANQLCPEVKVLLLSLQLHSAHTCVWRSCTSSSDIYMPAPIADNISKEAGCEFDCGGIFAVLDEAVETFYQGCRPFLSCLPCVPPAITRAIHARAGSHSLYLSIGS